MRDRLVWAITLATICFGRPIGTSREDGTIQNVDGGAVHIMPPNGDVGLVTSAKDIPGETSLVQGGAAYTDYSIPINHRDPRSYSEYNAYIFPRYQELGYIPGNSPTKDCKNPYQACMHVLAFGEEEKESMHAKSCWVHQNEFKASFGIANFKCRRPTEKCSCGTRMCSSFFRSVGVWGDGGIDKGGKVLGDWLDSRIKTDFNRDANYLSDRGNPSWLVMFENFEKGKYNGKTPPWLMRHYSCRRLYPGARSPTGHVQNEGKNKNAGKNADANYKAGTCTYQTSELYTSFRYSYRAVDLKNMKPDKFAYTFKVKAPRDAFVLLKNEAGHVQREIQIGQQNQYVLYRASKQGSILNSAKNDGILDQANFREFWISYDGNDFSIGQGAFNSHLLLKHNDPGRLPVKIELSTGFGSAGYWKDVCQIVVQDADPFAAAAAPATESSSGETAGSTSTTQGGTEASQYESNDEVAGGSVAVSKLADEAAEAEMGGESETEEDPVPFQIVPENYLRWMWLVPEKDSMKLKADKPTDSPEYDNQTTWLIGPGLAGKDTVSICSKKDQHVCLRRKSRELLWQRVEDNEIYKLEASFFMKEGISRTPQTKSFQSPSNPKAFICLDPKTTTFTMLENDFSLTYKYDCSVYLVDEDNPAPIPPIDLFKGEFDMTYDEAQNFCLEGGGRLAVLDTNAKNTMARKICEEDCGWIGLRCEFPGECGDKELWYWAEGTANATTRILPAANSFNPFIWKRNPSFDCTYWNLFNKWYSSPCTRKYWALCETFEGVTEGDPFGPNYARFDIETNSSIELNVFWNSSNVTNFTLETLIFPLSLEGQVGLLTDVFFGDPTPEVPPTAIILPASTPKEGMPTQRTDATIYFSSNKLDPTYECKLDSSTWSFCYSPIQISDLTDDIHVFYVRAISARNAVGPAAERSWIVNTTKTDVRVVPPTLVSDGMSTFLEEATFYFISDNPAATFECRNDTENFESCSSPFLWKSLSQGDHLFEVRTIQSRASATVAFTVDKDAAHKKYQTGMHKRDHPVGWPRFATDNGKPHLTFSDGTLNGTSVASFHNTRLLSHVWYHVAVSYECSDITYNGNVTLYIDGIPVEYVIVPNCFVWNTTAWQDPEERRKYFYEDNGFEVPFFDGESWVRVGDGFNGWLSTVRVWDKALSWREAQRSAAAAPLHYLTSDLVADATFKCLWNDTSQYHMVANITYHEVQYNRAPLLSTASLIENGGFRFGSSTECFEFVTDLPGWKFSGMVAAVAPGCIAWTELMPLDNSHFIALKLKGTSATTEVLDMLQTDGVTDGCYQLSFQVANRGGYGGNARLSVFVGGVKVIDRFEPEADVWQRLDYNFTTDTYESVAISFVNEAADVGDRTLFLDEVDLSPNCMCLPPEGVDCGPWLTAANTSEWGAVSDWEHTSANQDPLSLLIDDKSVWKSKGETNDYWYVVFKLEANYTICGVKWNISDAESAPLEVQVDLGFALDGPFEKMFNDTVKFGLTAPEPHDQFNFTFDPFEGQFIRWWVKKTRGDVTPVIPRVWWKGAIVNETAVEPEVPDDEPKDPLACEPGYTRWKDGQCWPCESVGGWISEEEVCIMPPCPQDWGGNCIDCYRDYNGLCIDPEREARSRQNDTDQFDNRSITYDEGDPRSLPGLPMDGVEREGASLHGFEKYFENEKRVNPYADSPDDYGGDRTEWNWMMERQNGEYPPPVDPYVDPDQLYKSDKEKRLSRTPIGGHPDAPDLDYKSMRNSHLEGSDYPYVREKYERETDEIRATRRAFQRSNPRPSQILQQAHEAELKRLNQELAMQWQARAKNRKALQDSMTRINSPYEYDDD